jgi:hypothetical protein
MYQRMRMERMRADIDERTTLITVTAHGESVPLRRTGT